MDWGNDYCTFSDTNISYLALPQARARTRLAVLEAIDPPSGVPAAPDVNLSARVVGSYEERIDPSLFVRFPLVDDRANR
jgi:hypothetical protein